MAQEQGIAKVDLTYIVKAVMMGNSLYSTDWQKGVLYLTNMNIWFSQGESWATVPLKNVSMIGREVTGAIKAKAQKATGSSHVLIIDYVAASSVSQSSTAASIALVVGPEPVINTLKTYLQPMCGTPPKAQSLSDIDKKMLYMLYTGVADLQKLSFLIGTDMDTITKGFQTLREQELCDAGGALTTAGLKKVQEMM